MIQWAGTEIVLVTLDRDGVQLWSTHTYREAEWWENELIPEATK